MKKFLTFITYFMFIACLPAQTNEHLFGIIDQLPTEQSGITQSATSSLLSAVPSIN
jgi:hypothetical protein